MNKLILINTHNLIEMKTSDCTMDQNKLNGKRILYIGLDYFGYPIEIIKELENKGAHVKFIPIYPPGNWIKLIKRLSLYLANKEINKYYSSLLENNDDYDYIFFIQVHWIPFDLMGKIKNKYQKSEFILYNWDSIETHNYLPYLRYFDKIFSFDQQDQRENKNIKYLPLFYSRHFESLRNKTNTTIAPKLLFIGAFNNIRRYNFVKDTIQQCEKLNIDFSYYLYINRLGYIRICLEYKKILNPKYFKFKKLNFEEIAKFYETATCIIDLPNNYQNGLTMRVIETLGAHKKLITTNKNILQEPVYNNRIISIIDSKKNSIDIDFISSHVSDSDFKEVENYSLKNWIENIFC